MAVSMSAIEKVIEPYTVMIDGVMYLRGDCVDEVRRIIVTKYKNVYTMIEEGMTGENVVVRDKLSVGNIASKVKKPIYEIYIEK